MWNANFPLPTGRFWCTHWALASNASKHSPWRDSYLPSYMVHSSGRLHECCLCPEMPPWGTGNALLMWTKSIISIFIYIYIQTKWNTHTYLINRKTSLLFALHKNMKGFLYVNFEVDWFRSRTCSKAEPAADRQYCLQASCTVKINDTTPFNPQQLLVPEHDLIYWSELK